ncbi:hypothetical protein ASPSYDRAFT_721863 [Aspergillus sydowii CBS 593.65]|uniref:Secreted protein n=1 Tax=Aspergillus sydowii CBS 593.65 TaxID=1036612 RepID=A0A1L9SXY5_9EURO|nr:uncharacterized protein ASPSYDRAFT_721863 [Aspergillus sydowii CBS 593.65]OJJ52045.1 hypothetical protein ASPSYDRAFT_721863 [Aspergillus sydowii CBS 593.65]
MLCSLLFLSSCFGTLAQWLRFGSLISLSTLAPGVSKVSKHDHFDSESFSLFRLCVHFRLILSFYDMGGKPLSNQYPCTTTAHIIIIPLDSSYISPHGQSLASNRALERNTAPITFRLSTTEVKGDQRCSRIALLNFFRSFCYSVYRETSIISYLGPAKVR